MSSDDTACLCFVCRDYGDRDQLDSIDTGLIGHVADPGWGVLAIPEDEISAGWAFTVGLWHSYRSPELALFGLDVEDSITFLNSVGALVAAGQHLKPGDELDQVIDDHVVAVHPADPAWHGDFFGTALGFYRATPDVPFLQLTWPDPDGHHPGHPEFAEHLAHLQPQLWLPRDQHPDGPWILEDED
ncbi:DUF4262 domain-containing protein [Actinokineospora globicatena]|uniref:DUF4262 domain-containing protein n=1 Tax=Actinokineospora globicatena TaxID=103729 RepID=A0A9W6QKU9_9PSEU|nr:DUF4262 domain-containing protein [Actinokineospora globicatena]GLW90073.1 hypothetical protein Aglo03_08890 [Actinokineospora globicatena]